MTTKLWLQLYEHDWEFQFTEDHNVWVRGQDEQDAIITEAHQSDEHRALYDTWVEMRRAGHVERPPLTHRGYEITPVGYTWVITLAGSDQYCVVAKNPQEAVEMVDQYLGVVAKPLPSNVIQFPVGVKS